MPIPDYSSAGQNTVDARARKLLLKGVRRFPANKDISKGYENYYCLDFCGDKYVKSSVFLGSNGVGKSSLFSALEKAYLKRLYSCKARGVNTVDEEIQYLKNLSSEESECVIAIETNGDATCRISIIKDKSKNGFLSYPSFFCTEWDVESLAKENEEDYIAEQLGISDFLTILNLCDRAIAEYVESENPVYLDSLLLAKELSKRLEELSDEEKSLSSAYYDRIHKDCMEINSEIHKFEEKFPSIVLTHEELDRIIKTRNFLQSEYETILSRLKHHSDVVFTRLFDAYRDKDILKISLEVQSGNRTPKIDVIALDPLTNKTIGTIHPRQYLNTFRFKLYCVALKISLAYCCKSLYNINAPIVIDDVFDSSDFQNREKIKNFIFDLYKAHEDLFGLDAPLQLIFFTQDDVIGESVFQGIRNYCPKEGAKFSRIFNFLEVDKEPDFNKNKDKSISAITYQDTDGLVSEQEIITISVEDIIHTY